MRGLAGPRRGLGADTPVMGGADHGAQCDLCRPRRPCCPDPGVPLRLQVPVKAIQPDGGQLAQLDPPDTDLVVLDPTTQRLVVAIQGWTVRRRDGPGTAQSNGPVIVSLTARCTGQGRVSATPATTASATDGRPEGRIGTSRAGMCCELRRPLTPVWRIRSIGSGPTPLGRCEDGGNIAFGVRGSLRRRVRGDRRRRWET